MLNIKFTYLKICGMCVQQRDTARAEITAQAQYTRCNTQLDHHPNTISITCLYRLHHHDAGKKCVNQSQLKPVALFGCSVFMLHNGLSHVCTLPARAGLVSSGRHYYLSQDRQFTQLRYPLCIQNKGYPAVLTVLRLSSAFLTAAAGSSPHSAWS